VSNIHCYTPEEVPECPADPCPGPDVINGEEEYEVEKILDSKYWQGQLVYLVKYKGWPNSNNEWLPAENLEHSQELLADFHHLHTQVTLPLCPTAPRTQPL